MLIYSTLYNQLQIQCTSIGFGKKGTIGNPWRKRCLVWKGNYIQHEDKWELTCFLIFFSMKKNPVTSYIVCHITIINLNLVIKHQPTIISYYFGDIKMESRVITKYHSSWQLCGTLGYKWVRWGPVWYRLSG